MKFALLSHVLPPSWSGQAVMIHRLLRGLDPDDYCLISSQHFVEDNSTDAAYTSPLPGKYCHLPPVAQLRRGHRFGLKHVREFSNDWLSVVMRGKQVAKIIRQEGCEAIVACSGDLIYLPAGYLASRLARVPFYAYLFDDYLFQWTRRLDRRFARLVEPSLVKGAAAVIAPNEFLRDEYRQRYGVTPVVIHNPCDDEAFVETDSPRALAGNGEVRIVYSGAVYHAHYDAFRNLLDAARQISQPTVKLHLYTAQPQETLEREQISGPVVFHNHIAPSDIFRVQREADILFLPLAFNSAIPEVIKTSAPGKLGEYLASGRPILVHAPTDSFVSWYFQTHNCGVVVGQSDPVELSQAIRRIIEDPELRRTVSENARACAERDFSLGAARDKFLKLFQAKKGGAGAAANV